MRALLLICLFGLPLVALKVFDTAPDFVLKGTDAKEYRLSEVLKKNKGAIVAFVATKCPYSNAYNARYNDLVKELSKNRRVAFLAVNSNDTEDLDEIKEHARAASFVFPVLKDENHKIADSFGAERTPEVFLIDQNRKVIYHGRIDNDSEGKNIQRRDLAAAVDEHVAGKPISVSETKAFGCTIKRK